MASEPCFTGLLRSMTQPLDEDWHFVCASDELGDEEVIQSWVDEVALAIYNLDGEFYATADTCSHQQASLSEGFVTDDMIECPLHQGRYHIATGAVAEGPACADLPVYPTCVHDGDVYVQYVEDA